MMMREVATTARSCEASILAQPVASHEFVGDEAAASPGRKAATGSPASSTHCHDDVVGSGRRVHVDRDGTGIFRGCGHRIVSVFRRGGVAELRVKCCDALFLFRRLFFRAARHARRWYVGELIDADAVLDRRPIVAAGSAVCSTAGGALFTRFMSISASALSQSEPALSRSVGGSPRA